MGNWFELKKKWFMNNRKYLYNDALVEGFIPIYDKKTNKMLYKFVPSDYDIAIVETIAKEKINFTNNKSNYDKKRSDKLKENKQFEGCFAEFVIAKFLIQILCEKAENVYVYDAERFNFHYDHAREYDVKVVKNNIEKRCEVRCSWSYKTTISEFCSGYGDVLGTYTNGTKKDEELADFFIRPILQLDNVKVEKNKKQLNCKPPENAIDLVKSKTAEMYVVAACTKKQMIHLGEFNEKLSKYNTKYFTVGIDKLQSINKFEKKYKDMFAE